MVLIVLRKTTANGERDLDSCGGEYSDQKSPGPAVEYWSDVHVRKCSVNARKRKSSRGALKSGWI